MEEAIIHAIKCRYDTTGNPEDSVPCEQIINYVINDCKIKTTANKVGRVLTELIAAKNSECPRLRNPHGDEVGKQRCGIRPREGGPVPYEPPPPPPPPPPPVAQPKQSFKPPPPPKPTFSKETEALIEKVGFDEGIDFDDDTKHENVIFYALDDYVRMKGEAKHNQKSEAIADEFRIIIHRLLEAMADAEIPLRSVLTATQESFLTKNL